MKVKMKSVVKISMTGEAVSDSQTNITAGGLTTVIDEPAARGGTGKGLSPTETFIASLVACTNRIAQRIAQTHGVEYRSFNTKAEAEVDIRGAYMKEEIDIPFPHIKLIISIETDAEDILIDMVKRDLPRFCPISKVVQASGTKLTEEWNIIRG